MHDVSRPDDFERTDADPRLISALAVGVAVFLIGAPFLLLAIYPRAGELGRLPDDLARPPPPRLQVAPKADLDRLHATENRELTTFGWVDRDKQIVRIPIEQAIKLIGDRGLKGWPSAAPQSPDHAPQ